MGKNKFFVSVAAGAAVGGIIALLDRNTRDEMVSWVEYLVALAKDPEQLTSSSRELIDRATTTAKQINEDVSFIKGKVENLKELTPQVKDLVEETKTTFVPEEQNPAAAADKSQPPS